MFSTAAVAVFALIASVATAPAPAPWVDDTLCAPGTGYFQNCDATGFRGCCNIDVCGRKLSSCPGNTWTPTPPSKEETPVVQPADSSACPPNKWFVCHNGFRGCCKTADPCTIGHCPAAAPGSSVSTRDEPAAGNVRRADDTVCPPGTGYFQSCSNGFRGCCTADVCSTKIPYCPGASSPIVPPVAPPVKNETPAPASAVQPQNGVCPSGTGYYQVCANGFKGCCAKDACSLGYCPN